MHNAILHQFFKDNVILDQFLTDNASLDQFLRDYDVLDYFLVGNATAKFKLKKHYIKRFPPYPILIYRLVLSYCEKE